MCWTSSNMLSWSKETSSAGEGFGVLPAAGTLWAFGQAGFDALGESRFGLPGDWPACRCLPFLPLCGIWLAFPDAWFLILPAFLVLGILTAHGQIQVPDSC